MPRKGQGHNRMDNKTKSQRQSKTLGKRILKLNKYSPDDNPEAVEILIWQAGIFAVELM